ncbi:unnamed protein product [Closterium sp. Naga37s-1]|nr:unnamed protein product [Closterium sp. Naga37s-1]
MLCIHWQEVLDVLRGMLPNDAVYTGHKLVGFTQGAEEAEGEGGGGESGAGMGSGLVKCVFRKVSGGEERLLEVETPVLLGADGIHSETRKHLLGGEEGRNGSGGAAGEGLLLPRHALSFIGLNRTATVVDTGGGKLYWVLTLVDSADPTVSSARSSGGEEAQEKILRAFEGWDVMTQLVKATPPDLILERRVLDLSLLPF